MPLPGDQHRESAVTANPYLPPVQRVTEYTAKEIATLQAKLDQQLGPEYISTRPGAGGGKLHYLAADKVINLANSVFGFNGWSSAIQNVQVDFVDENTSTGRISLGLSTIIRVTLRDGTFHEDMGYGTTENCKGKAAAFEKAKKEAVTDGLKRALRNFGNVLGNCLYDKDYLQRVSKIKTVPLRFEEERLYRHPSIPKPEKVEKVEVKRTMSAQSTTTATFEDDFDANIFDEADFTHPDEVRIELKEAAKPALPEIAKPALPEVAKPEPKMEPPPPREPPPGIPGGFVSGKAAALLDQPPSSRPPATEMAFDPHRESPSIPRTPGVNTGKSEPIKFSAVKKDFVNPANDPNRKLGMPRTSAYKPVKRPALADVSNMPEKKAKVDEPEKL